MHKLFLILFLPIVFLSISGKCLSDQNQEGIDSHKLPAIINHGYRIVDEKNAQALLKREVTKYRGDITHDRSLAVGKAAGQDIRLEPIEDKSEIDFVKISGLVDMIKKKLCSANQDGSYEVWLQVEGGASGVFVSASAQTA